MHFGVNGALFSVIAMMEKTPIHSPFPGMDPYLESYWRDIHHAFLTYTRDDLQPSLPGSLRARLEERVFVEPDAWHPSRGIYPDLAVVERPKSSRDPATTAQLALQIDQMEDPLAIVSPLDADEAASEGFIEIIDTATGNRVVTVIELLSPSNKFPGEGQDLYRRKQAEYRRGNVSLVEIDLLRSGQRVISVPGRLVPPSHQTTYSVCVTRGGKTNYWELYRVPLQKPLPEIKIPLRDSDPDVVLNLQTLIERCYVNGRYDDIDYSREPDPPLSPDDAAWARQRLIATGKRGRD
jgi:hypothetical protein